MTTQSNVKYLILRTIFIFLTFYSFSYSQSNCDNIKNNELISFIKNEYSENPLEGAKIISLNQCNFLISAGLAPISSKLTIMSRIAKTKAQRGVVEFLKGSIITSENILETREVVTEYDYEYFQSVYDYAKSESVGFINGMETLTAFKTSDGLNYVYILVQNL